MAYFKKYGVAGVDIDNAELAMSYTYTKSNGGNHLMVFKQK